VIQSIRDSRSRLALSRIREAASHNGAANMTLEEINREIAVVRKSRRSRK
jgi:hypothetical protein